MDIYAQLPRELRKIVQDVLEFNIAENYIKMWEAQNEYNHSIAAFHPFAPDNKYLQYYYFRHPNDEMHINLFDLRKCQPDGTSQEY